MKYRTFIFDSYDFNAEQKTLSLQYNYDQGPTFTETYRFDFDFVNYDQTALDRACQNLFFMAGVSYYKAYVPPEIQIKTGQLDAASAAFYSKTYQRGLGEFFFVNQLDPRTPITFPVTTSPPSTVSLLTPVIPALSRNPVENSSLLTGSPIESGMTENEDRLSEYKPSEGQLIAVGGGKDSLVSIEILRGQPKVATWSVGHREQLSPLIERISLPHFWVERTWDRQLLDLNHKDAYNGHIPISAIFAHVGSVVAILSGYSEVVMSNEASANEPTLHYQGVAINHQYSKSLEFEHDYQAVLQRNFGDSLQYYSLLRPLSEIRIAELFSKLALDTYNGEFSSCNRAFTHDSHKLFWCGECPKCAFIFLALTPFVERSKLENIFHGKNLLLDPKLEPTYRQLLGIVGDKPLECVGEIKENRAAMRLAQQTYPELSKYQFELPDDYDYTALAEHAMPSTIYQLLIAKLQN